MIIYEADVETVRVSRSSLSLIFWNKCVYEQRCSMCRSISPTKCMRLNIIEGFFRHNTIGNYSFENSFTGCLYWATCTISVHVIPGNTRKDLSLAIFRSLAWNLTVSYSPDRFIRLGEMISVEPTCDWGTYGLLINYDMVG